MEDATITVSVCRRDCGSGEVFLAEEPEGVQ